MSDAPTEEDLDRLRDENDKIREQIALAEAKRDERVTGAQAVVDYANLTAENERLKNELQAAKQAAQVGTVKDAVSAPLAQAAALLEAAKAGPVSQVPVDTNAGADTGSEKKDGE